MPGIGAIYRRRYRWQRDAEHTRTFYKGYALLLANLPSTTTLYLRASCSTACKACSTLHTTPTMPGAISGPRTLYDKVFDDHIVNQQDDDTILLYIDRHLYVAVAQSAIGSN